MLGTMIHKALAAIGVTPERVEHVTGKPCGCKERARAIDKATEVVVKAMSKPAWPSLKRAVLAFFRRARARRLEEMHAKCDGCHDHPLSRRPLDRRVNRGTIV